MRFYIRSDIRGRIRVHADIDRMSLAQADILEYYMRAVSGVKRVKVYDRTCDAVVEYTCSREAVTEALALFSFSEENAALVPEHTSRASDREYENRLVNRVMVRYTRRLLLPHPLRIAWCTIKASRYLWEGIRALWQGQITKCLHHKKSHNNQNPFPVWEHVFKYLSRKFLKPSLNLS